MTIHIYIYEHIQSTNPYSGRITKFLCTVHDNEALGFLARLLEVNGIEYKLQVMTYASATFPTQQN